jgi:hypothetical protein
MRYSQISLLPRLVSLGIQRAKVSSPANRTHHPCQHRRSRNWGCLSPGYLTLRILCEIQNFLLNSLAKEPPVLHMHTDLSSPDNRDHWFILCRLTSVRDLIAYIAASNRSHIGDHSDALFGYFALLLGVCRLFTPTNLLSSYLGSQMPRSNHDPHPYRRAYNWSLLVTATPVSCRW